MNCSNVQLQGKKKIKIHKLKLTNHRLGRWETQHFNFREVFNTLAAEDAEFMNESDEDEEVPSFGKSDDDYEAVVGPFYSFWSVYSTTRSYSWQDKYDTR